MAAGGAELSSGGPGLMFIYLVNVFNGMPGGKIVGIVFYVCVLFAGMSSLVNLYEARLQLFRRSLSLTVLHLLELSQWLAVLCHL